MRPVRLLLPAMAMVTVVFGEVPPQTTKLAPPVKASGNSARGEGGVGNPKSDDAPVVQVPSDYRVGPEDELTISVWHEAELSKDVVVRHDGMITLPVINDVQVAGCTTVELQALLTEKLKSLVNDPQVTIIVKAVHSRKVFLVGNVARQGVYPLGGRTTVLELIAGAGGLGPFAKKGSIYILRKEGGKESRIPFNYKKALSGKGADLVLQPGDMVVIP